jgi:toxin ParE1/3/4
VRIRWTPEAFADLEQLTERIAQESPDAALRVARRIYQAVESLEKSPNIGRPGWVKHTRELALAPLPYLVVYRVENEVVHIVRIHHGAQNWRHH